MEAVMVGNLGPTYFKGYDPEGNPQWFKAGIPPGYTGKKPEGKKPAKPPGKAPATPVAEPVIPKSSK